MAAPSPDEVGLGAKLLTGALAALSAVGAWVWRDTHKKIDAKASQEVFDAHVKSADKTAAALALEQSTQRGHIGKLFDKIEEVGDKTEVRFSQVERQAADRHIELMKAIHEVRK